MNDALSSLQPTISIIGGVLILIGIAARVFAPDTDPRSNRPKPGLGFFMAGLSISSLHPLLWAASAVFANI